MNNKIHAKGCIVHSDFQVDGFFPACFIHFIIILILADMIDFDCIRLEELQCQMTSKPNGSLNPEYSPAISGISILFEGWGNR